MVTSFVVNRADKRLVTNKFYVFEVAGETTFKMWPGGDPVYLAPHSTNPLNKLIFPKRKRDISVIGRVVRSVVDL
ncbi:MAG: hypothetical protein AB7V13_24420 [Pseudorhodoplanes sp.]|uniref:hypothetical protein n=1 Tax=Pseudorhodoplanes sp. TaxID=1934341 RepID=UPI003D1298B4